MELLKTEYRKQERVVGGDVRNMVTVMADIIDMTEASKSRTSEGELINIAEVKESRNLTPCKFTTLNN